MIYLELFWSFFQIGLFSIGGGSASMPMIQAQVVDLHHWLTLSEFADVVAISEMTPGPIGINSATFVGTRIAGLPGALIATLGCVIPSCIIVLLLAKLYQKQKEQPFMQGILAGLRPAVVALITAAGLNILLLALKTAQGAMDWIGLSIFLVSFLILRKWKPGPILVMLGAGAVGAACYLLI